MVNVFRLCSIINSLYGQVAGDLETCTYPWFPGVPSTSTLHNILSKLLADSPHNLRLDNGQWQC